MAKERFGIIGAGWRADFFLRVAQAASDRFEVAGAVVRDAQKAAAFGRKWQIQTFPTIAALLKNTAPAFVVVCAKAPANPQILGELAERGMPALCETPPARDLPALLAIQKLVAAGARIQVAEQYAFQPHHAAQLEVVRRGLIGKPSLAHISVAHGYHGMSLIRRFLGVNYEDAEITARHFAFPIVAGPGREGPPQKEEVVDSDQDYAFLNFGDRLGVFDFSDDQYFSWIRSERIVVRGERGEIANKEIRYLKDHRTPVQLALVRQQAGQDGNLEGDYLKGYQCGAEWVYLNPLAPARLSDEEIAIGTCLLKMSEYVRAGTEFYSFAEAAQDTYLSLVAQRAQETGTTIKTEQQPWALSR
jgi:hypothetical protein